MEDRIIFDGEQFSKDTEDIERIFDIESCKGKWINAKEFLPCEALFEGGFGHDILCVVTAWKDGEEYAWLCTGSVSGSKVTIDDSAFAELSGINITENDIEYWMPIPTITWEE